MFEQLKYRIELEVKKWKEYPNMVLYVGCNKKGNSITVICEETKQEIVDKLVESNKFDFEKFEEKGYGINDKFDESDYGDLIDEFSTDYYHSCRKVEEL